MDKKIEELKDALASNELTREQCRELLAILDAQSKPVEGPFKVEHDGVGAYWVRDSNRGIVAEGCSELMATNLASLLNSQATALYWSELACEYGVREFQNGTELLAESLDKADSLQAQLTTAQDERDTKNGIALGYMAELATAQARVEELGLTISMIEERGELVVTSLTSENERLKGALGEYKMTVEWYAEKSNWHDPYQTGDNHTTTDCDDIDDDGYGGKLARATISGSDSKGEEGPKRHDSGFVHPNKKGGPDPFKGDEGIRVVTWCFGQKFVNGKPEIDDSGGEP